MPFRDPAAPRSGVEREEQVQTLFSEIAPRYDLLNHVLSLNIDRAWRRKAIDRLGWERAPGGTYLSSNLGCNSCHDPHGKAGGRNPSTSGS